MKQLASKQVRLLLVLFLLLLFILPVLAQSGGGYDLKWSTTDGGGGSSAGGVYNLSGTIGQPDTAVISGGGYILSGGFWFGGEAISPLEVPFFLPLIVK